MSGHAKVEFDPAAIPGMIEPVEQQLLTHLGRTVSFSPGDAIIEFGTFFGRSTACLLKGLSLRDDPVSANTTLYAFDRFKCPADSAFAMHVRHHAQSQNLETLLQDNNGDLTFRKIFDTYLQQAQNDGRLVVGEGELFESQCRCESIALMHVDAPKDYDALRHILFEFFPRLCPGARIAFQDYFYHWSGTLIAAIQHLAERNILALKQSAASTVLAEVLIQPGEAALQEVDHLMQSEPHGEVIDRALKAVSRIQVDRPGQFVPRLALAKISLAWHEGNYQAAQQSLVQAMKLAQTNDDRAIVFRDFNELLAFGFEFQYG